MLNTENGLRVSPRLSLNALKQATKIVCMFLLWGVVKDTAVISRKRRGRHGRPVYLCGSMEECHLRVVLKVIFELD